MEWNGTFALLPVVLCNSILRISMGSILPLTLSSLDPPSSMVVDFFFVVAINCVAFFLGGHYQSRRDDAVLDHGWIFIDALMH